MPLFFFDILPEKRRRRKRSMFYMFWLYYLEMVCYRFNWSITILNETQELYDNRRILVTEIFIETKHTIKHETIESGKKTCKMLNNNSNNYNNNDCFNDWHYFRFQFYDLLPFSVIYTCWIRSSYNVHLITASHVQLIVVHWITHSYVFVCLDIHLLSSSSLSNACEFS